MSEKLLQYLEKIKADPQNTELLCIIGNLYKEESNFDKAEEYFKLALTYNNNYLQAYCSLISLYIDFGHYSKGLNLFQKTILEYQDNEKSKAIIINALFALFMLHKIDYEENKTSKHCKHNYEELFFRLGTEFKKLNHIQAALKVFETAVKLSSSNARLKQELAFCYINQHENLKAMPLLVELSDSYPEDDEILRLLISVFIELQDFNSAKDYSKRLLSIKTLDKYGLNSLAYCYIQLDYPEKACKYYESQIQANPESFESFRNLYIAYKICNKQEHIEDLCTRFCIHSKDFIKKIKIETINDTKNLKSLISL